MQIQFKNVDLVYLNLTLPSDNTFECWSEVKKVFEYLILGSVKSQERVF